jgi:hypothetical protein
MLWCFLMEAFSHNFCRILLGIWQLWSLFVLGKYCFSFPLYILGPFGCALWFYVLSLSTMYGLSVGVWIHNIFFQILVWFLGKSFFFGQNFDIFGAFCKKWWSCFFSFDFENNLIFIWLSLFCDKLRYLVKYRLSLENLVLALFIF